METLIKSTSKASSLCGRALIQASVTNLHIKSEKLYNFELRADFKASLTATSSLGLITSNTLYFSIDFSQLFKAASYPDIIWDGCNPILIKFSA